MKWTIFSRLVIGYLAIFVLATAMSVYAIIKIDQFNEVTQSVLMTNTRVIDFTGKLTDSLLSLIRYEKKFIITKDPAFHRQFSKLALDFERYLGEVMLLADSGQVRSYLDQVKASFAAYRSLFNEELDFLKTGNTYSQKKYAEEKETLSNVILEALDQLRVYSQENTNSKILTLYEAGIQARKMAIVLTGVFLVLGIVTSLLINRSITQPISILKKKTAEIAKGIFKGDLNLSSPPEIGELSGAFNLMCNKLNELDKMKSDFFSYMSHELRTPLSTIKMGVGLLRDGVEGPVTERQKSLLVILQQESNRLIDLVNSLLDLSKMEAGMMTYRLEQKNLATLIAQAAGEIAPLVEAKHIRLETMSADGLPLIKIDSERILQVLRNILGNAVKFTPEGGQVKVSVRSINQGVEVSISDTGPGIPADSLHSIFEKFKQVSSKGAHQSKGTGLGLAIAKQVVTHHGGKIWAESEPGHGSTFFFVLPA